jgi:hypothetical protein
MTKQGGPKAAAIGMGVKIGIPKESACLKGGALHYSKAKDQKQADSGSAFTAQLRGPKQK